MGQALYRKYRSRSFDDVVGQDHVTRTLKNALKAGKISHAYLLTGPRGVGKTSVARILAHEVNGLPYDNESNHLDIIEIDAASNRRIDEIRDLREKVHIAPTSAKYKVYIIDEVHMLTREAFNALLKTLEEPPNHCIFILATTEAHKLPETIISRTQRFSFKPVKGISAIKHLEKVAQKENIKIDNEALQLLIEHGEGSFRDSIGLLDQLSALYEEIDTQSVRNFLGLPADDELNKMLAAIIDKNAASVVLHLAALREQGTDATKIAVLLSAKLRDLILDGKTQPWIPKLLRQLLDVPSSHHPFNQLEISLLEAAAKYEATEQKHEDSKQPTPAKESTETQEPVKAENKEYKSSARTSSQGEFDLKQWPQVTEKVKKEAASVYTALRLAQPRTEDGRLILSFQFPLHQKKISQSKNIDIVARCIEDISGKKMEIICEIVKVSNTSKANDSPPESKTSVDAISNIFGSAEVLES